MQKIRPSVTLREDGPREGFQMLAHVVPVASKLELINLLSQTGIKSIEVTSFVRPDLVPQLADAEEVAEQVVLYSGVRYRALYLNEKGLVRSLKYKKLQPEGYIMLAASEAFLMQNNNLSIAQAIQKIDNWLNIFSIHQLRLERVMLSTAFGYHVEGRISADKVLELSAKAIARISAAGVKLPEITFADTTGYANPKAVENLVRSFKAHWPDIEVGLHLHDTRGTGMANVYAGLESGVRIFDCSVGGLGGCPFAKGAAGNVPTEDVAFLCEELGISTGVDLAKYIECARLAEKLAGYTLPGKLKNGGLILG